MNVATTPLRRIPLLLVLALLALSALNGCDPDDGDTTEDVASPACTIGAKTLELVAQTLREGRTARKIIEEYGDGLDKGCELAVKAWVSRPDDLVDITISDSSEAGIDEVVNGVGLIELAPKAQETNQPSCSNWTTELLRTLCRNEALEKLEQIINEQQG